MFSRTVWLLLFVVALMSGPLSILRECVGIFAPTLVPGPDLFWACLRIAALVSFFALWLREFNGRKQDRAAFQLRITALERDLVGVQRQLADDGPQITLEREKSINHPEGGLLLTTDKAITEARIQGVSMPGYSLTFDTLRSIQSNQPVSISATGLSADNSKAGGTTRPVLDEYFALFKLPLPLEIEYWDTRANRFAVRWYFARVEREGFDGPETRYELWQDPGSYRCTPSTPSANPLTPKPAP